MSAGRLWLLLLALLWVFPAPLHAQCVTLDPVVVSQPYNPMSATDYVAAFTVTAHRVRPFLSSPAAEANFVFLRKTTDSRPYELFVLLDDGGAGGTNSVFNPPGPTVQPGNNDAAEVDLRFGSSFQPDTRTFDLQLRIPAGASLPAGDTDILLDVSYLCEFDLFFSQRGVDPSAFRVRITVSSALQASLVGTELDFGEIGSLSTQAVGTAPLTTTQRRRFLRVASSGPYEVRAESQNAWRMTVTGAATSKPNEQIGYRFELLGQSVDATRRTFQPVLCRSAGTGGQLLPMTATLTEGGLGKAPSPTYRDIVTITVTPMAAAQAGSALPCP
jgi:hypothetical protein